jgi:hypothetical protein
VIPFAERSIVFNNGKPSTNIAPVSSTGRAATLGLSVGMGISVLPQLIIIPKQTKNKRGFFINSFVLCEK